MTPDEYERLREIFFEVCDLDEDEREAQLEARCGNDPAMLEKIRLLAAMDAKRTGLLDSPKLNEKIEHTASGAESAGRSAPLPTRIEHYRILRKIGEGGMGAVFEAEQDTPRRKVALKIVRPGAMNASLLKRFQHETEVLGRLQHPGIAQIYDAGTFETEYGSQPYFAMELIKGEPLLRFARDHHLDTAERLELVAKLCDAIQHAHTKGVTHRDLKPGNILVDDDGQPKILDFGVARATESDIQAATLHTGIGQLIGTVSYMSPEQADGKPDEIDARSDVYALGVVLYELLAGRLPYDLEEKMVHEAVRVIREDEPTHLSSVNRMFRGDIDTITAKSLEKNKERRYQTAAELAADIRRHLHDEPIMARPASAVYQFTKFAKRNKVLVGGAAAVFVALIGGIVGTTWGLRQALVAEAEESRQREIAEGAAAKSNAITEFYQQMIFAAAPHIEQGRDLTVREALKQASDRIERVEMDQEEIEAAVRAAIAETYSSLGEYETAERQSRLALDILTSVVGPEHADTLSATNALALILKERAKYDEAERLHEHTLDARRRTLGEDHPETLQSMHNLASLYLALGRIQDADELAVKTLDRRKKALPKDDSAILSSMQLEGIIARSKGDLVRAETILSDTLARRRRTIGPKHPDTLITMGHLFSVLYGLGEFSKSEALCREALELHIEVWGEEHPSTLTSLSSLAVLVKRRGGFEEAEQIYERTIGIQAGALGEDHPETLTTKNNLARLYQATNRLEEAEDLFRLVHEAARSSLGDVHPRTLRFGGNLGLLLWERGELDAAEQLLRSILDARTESSGPEHPETLKVTNNLALVLEDQGKLAEARRYYETVLSVRRRTLGHVHASTLVSIHNLAQLKLREGHPDESAELYSDAVGVLKESGREDDLSLSMLLTGHAKCLVAMERYQEAEPSVLEGIQLSKAVLGAEHVRTQGAVRLLLDLYEVWGKPEKAAAWRALLQEAGERRAPD